MFLSVFDVSAPKPIVSPRELVERGFAYRRIGFYTED